MSVDGCAELFVSKPQTHSSVDSSRQSDQFFFFKQLYHQYQPAFVSMTA